MKCRLAGGDYPTSTVRALRGCSVLPAEVCTSAIVCCGAGLLLACAPSRPSTGGTGDSERTRGLWRFGGVDATVLRVRDPPAYVEMESGLLCIEVRENGCKCTQRSHMQKMNRNISSFKRELVRNK